jgi:hypothetical protein
LGGLDVDLGRSLWSLHIVGPPKSPPSLFNPETRLRIVRRGRQWIAMHWDKRDDDLIPFDGLPCTVTLARGAHTATVTLHSHTWVEPPPAVHSAEWAWTGDPQYPVTLTLSPPARVWRVHLAALDPIAPPLAPAQPVQVVTLLDVELEGNFVASPDGLYRFRWAPRPSQQRLLGRYCTAAGALQYGTSLWFEDLVGHVSVPDALRWVGTPPLTASEAVVASFI